MKLATFGEIASFIEPRSGQRLPIRYAAYHLDDAELATLADCLVERVGDGGWARQLPPGMLASELRPLLFVRMAALAVPTITFLGRGAQILLDMGATAQWTGDLPIDSLVTPAAHGEGLELEQPPHIPE
ncbi:MAG TPA: hypothetical protein VES36_09355 [Candidatus Limnocylindrales bacterium]|nr:hypothetical protein [Candidatus Limnocylindrales bacterium]